MAKPGDNVHIPLKPEVAIKNLLKVKPTADMPRLKGTAKRRKKAKK